MDRTPYAVVRAASKSAGVPAEFLGGYLDALREVAATGRLLCRDEVEALRERGAHAAGSGIPLSALLDLYLAVSELAARRVPEVRALTPGALLAVTRRAAAALSDGYGRGQKLAAEQDDATRQELVDDLLAGRCAPDGLVKRAERFGIALTGEHVVVVVAWERPLAGGDAVARQVRDSLSARFGFWNVLVTVRDGQLVALASGGLGGGPAELLRSLVKALGEGERWRVGVGRPHPGVHGVMASYTEARNAIDLAERLGLQPRVLKAADLLVFPVLLRDREAITDLVTTVLHPLKRARGGAVPFLDTLRAFFACCGNTSATARELEVTPRAVVYRLDRIRSLTGYSATDPTQRFTLEAAVLGARLLGWPEGWTDGA
ncbi:PucR family transcriptional regulator [Streptomyces sp. AJS327]|nr:PucR family transcriptional regulator [Streptomyces sp. AJS327]